MPKKEDAVERVREKGKIMRGGTKTAKRSADSKRSQKRMKKSTQATTLAVIRIRTANDQVACVGDVLVFAGQ